MNYNKFNEEFEKKVYVSSTAEYNRNFTAKYKFKVFADKDQVFEFIQNKFLRNVMKKDINDLNIIFPEQNIGTDKKPVFVVVNDISDKKSIFAYRYKQGDDFYTIEIRVDKARHHSIVRIFRTVKWFKTIIGVNGQLGKRDFKKKHKAEALVIEKMTVKNFSN